MRIRLESRGDLTNTLVLRDLRAGLVQPPQQPVPVRVEDWQANGAGGRVQLSWRLAAEARRDLAGVRVQRAGAAPGPYVERSPALLPPDATMSFEDADVQAGHGYWYRLVLVSSAGEETSDAIHVLVTDASRQRTVLHAPVVQPGGQVEIRFGVGPGAGMLRLDLVDVQGRRVRALDHADRPPGEHLLTWDRRDDSGVRVPRGVYFVRLRANGTRIATKLALLRP